jgi:hypothetical protein
MPAPTGGTSSTLASLSHKDLSCFRFTATLQASIAVIAFHPTIGVMQGTAGVLQPATDRD